MNDRVDKVECRSEIEYAGRPTVLHWQGERLVVQEIIASWRSPEGKGFRVRTRSQQVFDLVFQESEEEWKICPV